MGCRMVSAEGTRVELPYGNSSVSGNVIVLCRGPVTLVTTGTGTGGTGMVLCEGGSGRPVLSMLQEAAPLAWQIASQYLARVVCWGSGRGRCRPAVSPSPENRTW